MSNSLNAFYVRKAPVPLIAMLFLGYWCGPASAQEDSGESEARSLLQYIEVGGVVELSATRERSYEDEVSNSTAAEQLELGIGIEPHDWIGTEVIWIHEHERDEEEHESGHDLGIIMATVVFGPPDGWWWLKGGVQFLPFTLFELAEVHAVHDASIGPFESGAIIDPLSFEYGSKREKSVVLGVSKGPFLGNVYGYHGDDERTHDPRTGFGAALGYKKGLEDETELAFNLSFIDDLGTLDSFQEGLFEQHETSGEADHEPSAGGNVDRAPGWSLATQLALGDVTVAGEYMIAQNRFEPDLLTFDGRGARPAAWSFEAIYGFELAGRSGDAMLGYQGTSEASGLGLPASRYLAVLSVELWNELLFGTFEWVHDRDYGSAYEGTGSSKDWFTVQLGLEF